jgi:hypothetical protein
LIANAYLQLVNATPPPGLDLSNVAIVAPLGTIVQVTVDFIMLIFIIVIEANSKQLQSL